jgi:hypothetical protein
VVSSGVLGEFWGFSGSFKNPKLQISKTAKTKTENRKHSRAKKTERTLSFFVFGNRLLSKILEMSPAGPRSQKSRVGHPEIWNKIEWVLGFRGYVLNHQQLYAI